MLGSKRPTASTYAMVTFAVRQDISKPMPRILSIFDREAPQTAVMESTMGLKVLPVRGFTSVRRLATSKVYSRCLRKGGSATEIMVQRIQCRRS